MDEWSANKPEIRAKAVWDRLLGCFGDSLLRKFGAEPPAEWVGALKGLTQPQIERGLRRIVFGWKGGAPSLPDFVRLCRAVGEEFDEGNQLKLPAPGEDPWEGKQWLMAGNRYLLGHIVNRVAEDPKRYGRGASYQLMRAPLKDLRELGLDVHNLDASQEFIENVHELVAAKNAWVADMEDLAMNGGVPVETQKAIWNDYVVEAERRIQSRQRTLAGETHDRAPGAGCV